MDSLKNLVTRSDDTSNSTVINLLIVLLSLVFFALVCVGLLVFMRRVRRQRSERAGALPQYHDVKRTSNHRRLTIQTGHLGEKDVMGRSSIVIYSANGQPMLANPLSPPHSAVNAPEIHLTFPDEQDEAGKRKSGRVLVVRVGDATVGLEPLKDEQLPAYEQENSTQFYAIDLEKIGGLKEREDYH